MPGETPRLGLGTYEQGDEWDHTDTVEAVDEHAIEHGPIAERPAAGEYDDELFHATDQGITWRWDASGNDWEYFSGQGRSDQPVPGTSHYESVSTERASITQTVTMYVRSDGSDSNNGLSSSSAKATIKAAIEDAPLIKYSQPLIVDIAENGESFTGVDLRDIAAPKLIINGVTDGSGDPDVSIIADDLPVTLENDGATVTVRDCIIEGGNRCYRNWNGYLQFKNCLIQNADRNTGQVNGGFVDADEETVHDQTEVVGDSSNINVLAGHATYLGPIKGDGDGDYVIRVKEGAQAMIAGDVTGEGQSETRKGVIVRHNGSAKVYDATISDCQNGIEADQDGQVRTQNVTYENVGNELTPGNAGYVFDEDAGEHMVKMPDHAGAQSNWDGGSWRGTTIFNSESELLAFYDGDELIDAGHDVIWSQSVTFDSGETKSGLFMTNVEPGDDFSLKWNIESDPGNDAGLELNKIWYDSSEGVHRASMTETEDAGGGTFVIKAVREQ